VLLGLAALVGAAFVVPAGAARTSRDARVTAAKSRTVTVEPGLTFTTVTKPRIPLKYYVLAAEPQKAVSIDTALAGSQFGDYQRLSTIGSNHNAVAGISGDFSDSGMPVHPFAEDGALMTSGLNKGASFSVARDELDSYLNNQNVSVSGLNARSSQTFAVDEWNAGDPGGGDVSAFTQNGGSRQDPPKDACSARLFSASAMRYGAGGVGLVRDFEVDRVVCQASATPLGGGMLLTAKRGTSAANNVINRMRPGDEVTLTWRVADWRKTMDVLGGAPLLVQDGHKVASDNCDWYFCDRNPRSGVGIKADGTVLLIVVDGRSSSSKGVTPEGFASIFLGLNARFAVNLDGGGGATMWVRGRGVVNRPSDGSERPLTNAILVLPGNDNDEPNPSKLARGVVSERVAAAADRAAMRDPASTGGLFDAFG
jgi:hypothetical protein